MIRRGPPRHWKALTARAGFCVCVCVCPHGTPRTRRVTCVRRMTSRKRKEKNYRFFFSFLLGDETGRLEPNCVRAFNSLHYLARVCLNKHNRLASLTHTKDGGPRCPTSIISCFAFAQFVQRRQEQTVREREYATGFFLVQSDRYFAIRRRKNDEQIIQTQWKKKK
jgi:hypothetical protein